MNEKLKNNGNILSLLKPYSKQIIGLIILTILANGLNLIIPKIISNGIDGYIKKDLYLYSIIIDFFSVSFLIFLFTYFQNILQVYTSELVARDLRNKLVEKISTHDYNFIQLITPSKLLTNLTGDIDSIKVFVSQAISSIVSSLFLIIGASILILIINWKLALGVLLIVPIIGFLFYFILSKVRELFKKSQETIDWLNKIINESILGASLIRLLNSSTFEYIKFLEANKNAKQISLQILGYFATLIPMMMFISNLAILIILFLGGHFVILGDMTLGDFSAFNSYLSILIFPIIMIGFISGFIAQSMASYSRILEILNSLVLKKEGTIVKNIEGKIDVSNISLKIGEKYILKDISFSIKPKTKTAIIGPTAAGKTQLLYILMGLIDYTLGDIKYDDENINNFSKKSFHEQIALVFQDSILFNLTLRENIAFNNNVKNIDLEKAINTAELNDFIESLPEKLDTIVSEKGTNLSGGQKQRIMLARALALNPKILFLDDFTARLDLKTEKKILENISNNYPDITLISITQKIETIKDYNNIILLMEGELLAIGSHDELLKNSTEYIQIYNSQLSTNQ